MLYWILIHNYDGDKHGILSTVITYHTSFKYANSIGVLLYIPLGSNISVEKNISLSFIKTMKLELWFDPKLFLSHKLKKQFLVVYAELKLTKSQALLALYVDENGCGDPKHHGTFNTGFSQAVELLNSILYKVLYADDNPTIKK